MALPTTGGNRPSAAKRTGPILRSPTSGKDQIRRATDGHHCGARRALNAAVKRIGPRVGIVADTLRGWRSRFASTWPGTGTTTADAQRIKQLEAEVRELQAAIREIVTGSAKLASKVTSTAGWTESPAAL